MFRYLLPAALCLFGPFALAQGASDKALSTNCTVAPNRAANCVRVLACIGTQGVWFDGQAHGWDRGIVIGKLQDGTPCRGNWSSGGFLGTGSSSMACENGLQADVIYYSQDNASGTVLGRGLTNTGQTVQVWSGENVLQFLSTQDGPVLPCSSTAHSQGIPLS